MLIFTIVVLRKKTIREVSIEMSYYETHNGAQALYGSVLYNTFNMYSEDTDGGKRRTTKAVEYIMGRLE